MGKRIGIITMHKVLNCGSALQAYALQKVITDLGYDVELIDYNYPNKYHTKLQSNKSIFSRFYSIINSLRIKMYFSKFYKNFFILSSETYSSKEQLEKNPPKYDVYITGSDQVWNPKYIGNDLTFMLSFTKEANKISYSSSIANCIPSNLQNIYASALKQYRYISVREEMSCSTIKDLTGSDAYFVVDPSLLLPQSEWSIVIESSSLRINYNYILIYVLGYSFDVYEYSAELINHISGEMGLEVLVLIYSRGNRYRLNKYKSVEVISPENFLYLISHASFIITDSFHATAFSINFSKPFYALINKYDSPDNRIVSLLKSFQAEDRLVCKGTDFNLLPSINMDYTNIKNILFNFREYSMNYLKTSINECIFNN